MKIESREVDGAVVLKLEGKIALGRDTTRLRNTVAEQIRNGNKKIILDMGDISYIDSSGIETLVSCWTIVTNMEGKLVLLNLNDKIRELLSITNLLSAFHIAGREDEALALLRYVR